MIVLEKVRIKQRITGLQEEAHCSQQPHLAVPARPPADAEIQCSDVFRLIYVGSQVSPLGVYLQIYIPVEHHPW